MTYQDQYAAAPDKQVFLLQLLEQSKATPRNKELSAFLLQHTRLVELNPSMPPKVFAHAAAHDQVNRGRFVTPAGVVHPSRLKNDIEQGKYRVFVLALGEGPPTEETLLGSLFVHEATCALTEDGQISNEHLPKNLDRIFLGQPAVVVAPKPGQKTATAATFLAVSSFYINEIIGLGDRLIQLGTEAVAGRIPGIRGTENLKARTTLSPLRGVDESGKTEGVAQKLEKRLARDKAAGHQFFPKATREFLLAVARKMGLPQAAQQDAGQAFFEILRQPEGERRATCCDSLDCYQTYAKLEDIKRGAMVKMLVEERDQKGRSLLLTSDFHLKSPPGGKGGAYVADIIASASDDKEIQEQSVGAMANNRYDDTCEHETKAPKHSEQRAKDYREEGILRMDLALINLYNDWEMELAKEENRQPILAEERGVHPPREQLHVYDVATHSLLQEPQTYQARGS